MSRESKIFSTSNKHLVGKRVKEYEAFGWELLSINGTDVSMSRETQNKVYSQLVKYEYEYDELRDQQDKLIIPIKPKPFNFGAVFIGLIAFVLPGALYIGVKYYQTQEYKNGILNYNIQFNKLEEQIKKTCDQSRSVFFSRQEA